jgi:hypothetical protein
MVLQELLDLREEMDMHQIREQQVLRDRPDLLGPQDKILTRVLQALLVQEEQDILELQALLV